MFCFNSSKIFLLFDNLLLNYLALALSDESVCFVFLTLEFYFIILLLFKFNSPSKLCCTNVEIIMNKFRTKKLIKQSVEFNFYNFLLFDWFLYLYENKADIFINKKNNLYRPSAQNEMYRIDSMRMTFYIDSHSMCICIGMTSVYTSSTSLVLSSCTHIRSQRCGGMICNTYQVDICMYSRMSFRLLLNVQ